MKYVPDKVIPVPPFGRIDVSKYMPIINCREFQLMRDRTQLGLVDQCFPNAKHTRFAHSLGAMQVTRKYFRAMKCRGFFNGDSDLEKNLEIAALLHDIGHPPYSHATEYVVAHMAEGKGGHKQAAAELIKGPLARPIRECGGDPDRVGLLLDKKSENNPGRLLTAKGIGADKVAYLWQDLYMTDVEVTRPAGDWRAHMSYLCFIDGDLAVEEKMQKYAQSLQEFYHDMWTLAYLRKQSLCAERLLQKAVEWHIADAGLDPAGIWARTESWLDTQLAESGDLNVRRISERIKTRNALKAAISFKQENYCSAERVAAKPLSVVGVDPEKIGEFVRNYENPLMLTELENLVARNLKIRKADIAVAVVPEPEKLVPEDIKICDKQGNPAGTLFERLPGFRKSLEEKADAFVSIRVMVPEEKRKSVSRASERVCDIIAGHSGIKL
ncbi:HD domain-containing protein [Candidatus Woesearchaeota archaeon]|nr:HD domain-containing protein [Candidatus Woesearchaeota archaeon]